MVAAAACMGTRFVFMSYFLKLDHLCVWAAAFDCLNYLEFKHMSQQMILPKYFFLKSLHVCTLQRDLQLQAYGA